MQTGIQVYSEIGTLKTVLLHRPGGELNNLTPDWMEDLLFDELPFLQEAQKEHDAFAEILRGRGVEVLYLEQLLADVIAEEEVRKNLISDFLDECELRVEKEKALLRNFLEEQPTPQALVEAMMAGTRRSVLPAFERVTLREKILDQKPFAALPMPNLYFTRDPFSFVGRGVALSHMWSMVRNRETLFGKYIFQYHERFQAKGLPRWYDRGERFSLEGGDVLVLSEEVIAVGLSQRTKPEAIETFARKILFSEEPFQRILVFHIPSKREFMHLDTVFTMVDRDLFTLHPLIQDPLQVFCLRRDGNQMRVEDERGKLDAILGRHLKQDRIRLLPCGGQDPLDAAREQWNDGSNTLAIAPGEVVVYDRNRVTNQILREAGVRVHEMPSGELSRGRGGPRCMSMPLWREAL